MKSAVLLLSSGLDSAANLALSRDAGFEVKLALTIDYGQRAARREVEMAGKLAEYYGVEHLVVDLSSFPSWISGDFTRSKSALLDRAAEVPHPDRAGLDDLRVATETAKQVWVPNRNGIFLSIAAAVAESRGLQTVAVGFNAEEAVTFPDNTKDYMEAMTESLRYSTANHVQVVSATHAFTKSEIVRKLEGSLRKFPWAFVWSCYEAGEANKQCGRCESCKRLTRALQSAGLA